MMDLIDRQAAIDVLHMDTSIIPYEKAREYADATILEIRNRLEKLPSAQPEPCVDVVSREYLTEHIEACWINGRMSKPDLNEVLSWINDVPSAQPDVPDTNVGDMISRQATIDAFLTELTKRERKNLLHTWSTVEVKYFVTEMLEQLPSAQPDITPDGTLTVSIDADIANVGRILLSQTGTQRGGLYYKDEQPETKWIPCKERLPDKDGLYLVTYFSGHARWTGTDEFLVDGTEESQWKYANVIAWQPLPEPFREEGGER